MRSRKPLQPYYTERLSGEVYYISYLVLYRSEGINKYTLAVLLINMKNKHNCKFLKKEIFKLNYDKYGLGNLLYGKKF